MGKAVKKSNLILEEISISGSLVRYTFSVSENIERFFTTKELWIEYEKNMEGIPESILAIPFVSIFMAFCWITDSVLWVDELDDTFYHSIPNIKRGYEEIYDWIEFKGRVVPSKIIKNRILSTSGENKALVLFSGGADCHASYIRNRQKKPILFNIQGWYKNLGDVDPVANADKRDISRFALEQNILSSHARSNFAVVISNKFDSEFEKRIGDSWWHGFVHSMAFISIAIPLCYKLGITEIIIASSLTKGLNFLCASNSTTDSEFNFAETGHTLHDGFELNRQDKIKVICDYQRELNKSYFMRVCSFHDKNCCECEKCFRTVLGIVAEGNDPEDFGFHTDKTLRDHWQDVMNRRIAMMGFGSENLIHWPHIKKRMMVNYDKLTEEQKEFVDWFMSYDFLGEKKRAVRRYHRDNFFPLVIKKLKDRFS